MKRRFSNLVQVGVFVLLLVGAFYSISDACVFIGVVKTSPGMSVDTLDSCFAYMRVKTGPTTAPHYGDNTNCGWTIAGYGDSPPEIVYKFRDSLSQPYTDPTVFYNSAAAAFNAGANVFVSHARQLNGTHPEYYHCNEPDPHPFIYRNDTTEHGGYVNDTLSYRTYELNGKEYSFLHNGTVQVQTLMNSLGAGFGALDIFHNRYFSYWNRHGNTGTDRRVDTEHYAMVILKNLMVQYNYYWDSLGVPANHPSLNDSTIEEWALRKTASYLSTSVNSSMNGIFADGAALWAIAKSDGARPHTVGYRVAGDGTCRIIQSDICTGQYSPTNCDTLAGQFTHLNESINNHNGQILCMPGDIAHSLYVHNMDSASDFDNTPKELRINSRGHSAGNQISPAIAVDSTRGCFTAVWMSNNAVMGRWYNQMGMAENDEFIIDNVDPYAKKGQPAVAISSDGKQMTVVWLEGIHDPSPALTTYGFSMVRQRIYSWDNNTHSWDTTSAAYTVGGSTCQVIGSADQLRHPSVAYARAGTGDHGYHAVTWEQCCDGNFIRVRSLMENTFHHGVVTISTNGQEPDIAYVRADKYVIVYGGPSIPVTAALYYENTGANSTPAALGTGNGQHPSVARRDSTRFLAAFCDGQIKIHQGSIGTGDVINLDGTINSPNPTSADNAMRPDISVPSTDGQFYACFDTTNGSNRNICCMHYDGTNISRQGVVNQFTSNVQEYPVIAIAPSYPSWNGFYGRKALSADGRRFEIRRMILWQTDGQDGDGWGIAGQFRGINGGIEVPWSNSDRWQDAGSLVLSGVIVQSTTLTEPNYELDGEVVVPAGVTLTISSGVSVQCDEGASLNVAGTLIAAGCTFTAEDPSHRWSGITVSGSATISGCTIEGADIGIQEQKATSLTVSGCTIQSNGVGIYIYEPSGTSGAPEISNCTIMNNDAEGISLFSTYKADIHDCPNISSNGTDGIFLNDSYAILNNNHFSSNADYGVDCYGSSPVLYCNTFSEDKKGEMYLVKYSYPVLWTTNGVNGGSNTFANTNHTLITMTDSYPVVANGLNKFSIYGTGGYYMADMSASVPKHYVNNNEWNKTPPPDSTFWPVNPTLWSWSPTQTYGGCGSPKGSGSNAAQELFTQGFTAEMAGNSSTASTDYVNTISQYPDSCWAEVAATRLFENLRQADIDSAYAVLRAYYAAVQANHPEDSSLAKTAADLAPRTMVEESQFVQAMMVYQQTMSNPPSNLDSAYAALDYAITVMRAELDSLRSHLDSPLPVVSTQTIRNLVRSMHGTVPPVPEAHHENYLKPPETWTLEQNYPNPFNATTTLRYAVPAAGWVKLSVYNILGQKVATLVDGMQPVGYHAVTWNGTNVASGVYIYRLEAQGHTLTHKMLLLK
jgi:hypothetical protein